MDTSTTAAGLLHQLNILLMFHLSLLYEVVNKQKKV